MQWSRDRLPLGRLGFKVNGSVLSSEGRVTRTFDFYELECIVHGPEISWAVPYYLGLRLEVCAGHAFF